MTEKKTNDFVKQFHGAITLERCKKVFGADKAHAAFYAAAVAGGYGAFNVTEAKTVSLAVPKNNKELAEKINAALNNLD